MRPQPGDIITCDPNAVAAYRRPEHGCYRGPLCDGSQRPCLLIVAVLSPAVRGGTPFVYAAQAGERPQWAAITPPDVAIIARAGDRP